MSDDSTDYRRGTLRRGVRYPTHLSGCSDECFFRIAPSGRVELEHSKTCRRQPQRWGRE